MFPALCHVTALLGVTFTCFKRLGPAQLLVQLGLPLAMMVALFLTGLLPTAMLSLEKTRWTDEQDFFKESNDSDNQAPLTIAYCPETNWTRQLIDQMKLRLQACGATERQIVFDGYMSETVLLEANTASNIKIKSTKNQLPATQNNTIDLALVFKRVDHDDEVSRDLFNDTANYTRATIADLEIVIRPRLGRVGKWQEHFSKKMDLGSLSSCPENAQFEDMSHDVNSILHLVVESIVKTSNPSAPHIEISTTSLPFNDLRAMRVIVPICINIAFLPGSVLLVSYFKWRRRKDVETVLRLIGVSGGINVLADLLTVVIHVNIVSCCVLIPLVIGHYNEVLACQHLLPLILLVVTYGLAADSFAFVVSVFSDTGGANVSTLVVLLNLVQLMPAFTRRFSRSHTSLVSLSFYGSALDLAAETLLTGTGHGYGILEDGHLGDKALFFAEHFFPLVFLTQSLLHCCLGAVALNFRCLPRFRESVCLRRATCRESMFCCRRNVKNKETLPAVKIRNLNHPGDCKGDGQGLENVSFDIKAGETVAVLGPPLSGKTTLVKILTGQIKNYTGSVEVDNVCPGQYIARQPGTVGLCPQHNYLLEPLTVNQTFRYFKKLSSNSYGLRSSDDLLSKPILKEIGHLCCCRLSTFQVKLVQIAIAYMNSPRLVVHDEPTTGVDEKSSMSLEDLIQQKRGTTLLSTSSARLALKLANRIVLLAEGQVLFVGTGQELKDSFGAGYFLTIGLRSRCNIRALTNYLRLFEPGLYVFSSSTKRLICVLPDTPTATSRFEFVLANLDLKKRLFRLTFFTLQRVTIDNLLEWLPDTHCLLARMRQIAACREVMEDFHLDELVVKTSTASAPTVIYSTLRRSLSNDDIRSLQKELNKLCLNNSNSAHCGLWYEHGELGENCVDTLRDCESVDNSRAVDPLCWCDTVQETRAVDPLWCCDTFQETRAAGPLWSCDTVQETRAVDPLWSCDTVQETRAVDPLWCCDTYHETQVVDTAPYNTGCSINFQAWSWADLEISKMNNNEPTSKGRCCKLDQMFLKSQEYSDNLKYFSSPHVLSFLCDKSIQRASGQLTLHRKLLHAGEWWFFNHSLRTCRRRFNLFTHYGLLQKLLIWVTCLWNGSNTHDLNFSFSLHCKGNCLYLLSLDATSISKVTTKTLICVQRACLPYNLLRFLSHLSHLKLTFIIITPLRLKTVPYLKTSLRFKLTDAKSNHFFQMHLPFLKIATSKCVARSTHWNPSTPLISGLSKRGKWFYKQNSYLTKHCHGRSMATRQYILGLHSKQSSYCKASVVLTLTNGVRSEIRYSKLHRQLDFLNAMDRNQSANPDSFTPLASLRAAKKRIGSETNGFTGGIFRAIASKFIQLEASTSQVTGSKGSSLPPLEVTVPYQVLGSLDSHIAPLPLVMQEHRDSFYSQKSSWNFKLWHIFIALQGKLLVYTVRAPMWTLLQMFIPLIIVNLACMIPALEKSPEKLTFGPCLFASERRIVDGFPKRQLGSVTAHRNFSSCQTADLHIWNRKDTEKQHSREVVIGERHTKSTQNSSHTQLSANVFYRRSGCLAEIKQVTTLLQSYFRCYHLRMPAIDIKEGVAFCHSEQEDHASLRMSVHPLPVPDGHSEGEHQALVVECVVTSVGLMMSLTWVTATFICVLVQERVRGFYHLQNLSGINSSLHLVAMAFLHLTISSVSIVIALLPLFLVESPLLLDAVTLTEALALYILATLPQMYTLQWCFRRPSVGVLVLWLLYSTLGTLCFWPVYPQVRLDFDLDAPDISQNIWVSRLIVPSSSLTYTLFRICVHGHNCYHGPCSSNLRQAMFLHAKVMTVHGIVWLLFLFVSQQIALVSFRPRWSLQLEMMKEQMVRRAQKDTTRRSMKMHRESRTNTPIVLEGLEFLSSPIVLKDVTKFGKDRSVKVLKNVSFKVSTGSCFGILGKGTGKSTLLRLLAGLSHPDTGMVKVCADTTRDFLYNNYKPKCGLTTFCLPSCRLMPELTGRETLHLLGWLRGASPSQIEDEINCLLDLLRLTAKADTVCALLNPADRFKMRLCAALIGDPKIVLLDLPSQNFSLLDFKALGEVLARLRSCGTTVVLATEIASVCEALCTDIHILRRGVLTRVRKVSSCLRLSVDCSKYCQGYLVHMVFREGDHEDHKQFFNEVAERIVDLEIFTDEKGTATFHLLGSNVNLVKLFVLMEDGLLQFGLGEYSVVQADVGFLMVNDFASQESHFDLLKSSPETDIQLIRDPMSRQTSLLLESTSIA